MLFVHRLFGIRFANFKLHYFLSKSNCRRACRGVNARRGEMKLPRVYPRRACLGVKGIKHLNLLWSTQIDGISPERGDQIMNDAINDNLNDPGPRVPVSLEKFSKLIAILHMQQQ